MGLRCMTGRHIAAPGEVRNQGFDFTRCNRCGRDMIRSGNRWRVVPKGFRVVWRGDSRLTRMVPAQLLLDLPAIGRDLVLRHERVRARPSDLVILAVLGVRYLLWAAGERIRAWRRGVRMVRQARQPIICLPSYAAQAEGPAS